VSFVIIYHSLNIVFCVGNYPDIDAAAKAIATINSISHTQVKYDLLDKESYQLSPCTPVPEIIDTVFAKTSPKPSFSMTEYWRFGLVFTKTRVYKFGHRGLQRDVFYFG
jgi:hypothetical protein